MTNIIMSSKEARENFSEILGQVRFGQKVVTIQKQGKPYGVLISPEQYEAFQKAAKNKLFAITSKIQSRNTDYDEEEVLTDVTNAVEEVRNQPHGHTR